MNRKRTAVMIMAAFFAIGTAPLIGAGPAAAVPDGGGVVAIYPYEDFDADCDNHPHRCPRG
ncbi:hypothetical protein ACFFMN_06145 [Planobispora siamensis]|uniref:Secreted protein n=1 Tax=Planobispora siamensis TaxID=936338 RepID=A0A8J3WM23_9ACTN|nr:hypothetical protein [Planobispora siamensis]GIH94235.1 hypothetical protein Psi01_48650 [Planobispora siamensis]